MCREINMTTWSVRDRVLDFGERALIMGIVNVTPDSFSDGGRFSSPAAAIAHGLELVRQGADILDIGANRPGPERSRFLSTKNATASCPSSKDCGRRATS